MSSVSSAISTQNEADRGDELDLVGLGQAIARKKWLIIGAAAGTFLIALTFVSLVKARYTGESKVIIENQESYFTRPDRASEPSSVPDDATVASAVQLVTSRDLAREVIKSLNLRGNSEFDPAADGVGLGSRVMMMLGLKRSPADVSPEDRIFETYFDRLTVFNVTKSRVLQIEFTSNDPDLAARGANTVASLYIDVQSKAKRESARIAASSLGSLLGELRSKLADAEARAEDARTKAGLMIGSNNSTISNQKLSDINGQMTVARTTQADANAKARLLREAIKTGRLSAVTEVANNDLVRRLSESLANLHGQIAMESRTLLPNHPRIKELNAQLGDLEGELRSAANRAAQQLDHDALVAKARVENLQAALDQQKRNVGGSSGDEVRQRELDREVKSLRDQVDSNTAKYQDAIARQEAESTPGDARIISRAVAPQLASFPKKVPILIFGAIAGLVFSFAWVVASELLSGRAFVNGAAKPVRNEPSIGFERGEVDRDVDFERPMPAVSASNAMARRGGGPERTMADSLSRIAKQISAADPGEYALRVLVTGEQEGVTQSALNLARTLAVSRRTILVDLDGTDVSRNGFGALANVAGLGELVAGEASFSEVIHRDRLSRLHLLPLGHGVTTFGHDLEMTIDALSQTYDFVVFATPPAPVDDTALDLGPAADYVVILTKAPDGKAISDLRGKFVQAGAGEVLVANDDASGRGPGRRTAA